MDTQLGQPERLYIHFSVDSDFDRVKKFYDSNAHRNVFKRNEDMIRALVENGSVILVENEKGDIVASSITYPMTACDAHGVEHVRWSEVGTTRIVANGFPGLFDVMVTMQVLHTYLVEPPEDRLVAQMDTAPVQNMAKRLGWREFEVPAEVLRNKEKMLSSDGSIKAHETNWYQCGVEALPVMACFMINVVDHPVIENLKTHQKVVIDCSRSKFFKVLEPEIRALAGRNLGDVDHPDPQRGLAESRQKWLRSFR